MPDVWIQLENRPWDTMPNNIDRMTGKNAQNITTHPSEMVTITSPDAAGTGIRVSHSRRMYAPLRDGSGKVMDALIFRRYKAPDPANGIAEWQVPDDRKVNPWDINEKDPTDNGTMGTIPGPVIECNVGESVIVHFRNMDMRLTKAKKARAHSIHVHGFVFKQEHDGAYPLSLADTLQPIPPLPDPERTAWNDVGVTGPNKMGDRVPPGGTFIYTWNTFGWPTTAGVWLYHDHSFCDMANMGLGAIGIVVIHNTAETENDFTVSNADFPDNSPTGNPIAINCLPIFPPVFVDNSILHKVGIVDPHIQELINPGGPHEMAMLSAGKESKKTKAAKHEASDAMRNDIKTFAPNIEQVIQEGNMLLHLNPELTAIIGRCTSTYKTPPTKAIYLQLYHKLTNAPGMSINGRSYLGNTPSVVAGTATKMRFGVVGMGQTGDVHTFHIHGHRWIVPGPHGTTPGAIQGSPLDTPVSQFEDTRIFGPANSFGFTIDEKGIPQQSPPSFMRAGGPSANDAKGEWHMHCHFLDHMMQGMMGSLLIVDGGQAVILPRGEECPQEDVTPAATIVVKNFEFAPKDIVVPSGTVVTFNFVDTFHTVTTAPQAAHPLPPKIGIINEIEINGGPSPNTAANSNVATPLGDRTVTMTGNMGDKIHFQCGIHFAPMEGSITIM